MEGLGNAVILSLAWLALVNSVVSLLAWMAARWANAREVSPSPGVLLALRLLPASASVLFVSAIFVPVHWRFEPRGMDESFGFGVYVLAAVGAALAGTAVVRALRVAGAGWKLRGCARLPRIATESAGATDVYEVRGMSGVSLAGVVRPRILVGPAVRETLTEAELRAAVAHELAHRAALDNIKRFAIFCAPDLFGRTAAARRLEERWSAAAEWQADARAVQGDESRALHLASALVKVARLNTTPAAWGSPAWSTLHDAPLLESRVRRLIGGRAPSAGRPAAARVITIAAVALYVAIAAAAASAPALHTVTEALAHLLP